MTTRLVPVRPEAMSAAQRELYDAIVGGPRAAGPQHFALTREDGSLRGPFDALLRSPRLGVSVQELGAAIRYGGTLTSRAREIAILLVAARWDSQFEREAHEAVGRAVGLTESELEALRCLDPGVFSGDERIIAEATVQLADGDLDDELWARAIDVIGEPQFFELTVLVGYYAMLALQLRVFRVQC